MGMVTFSWRITYRRSTFCGSQQEAFLQPVFCSLGWIPSALLRLTTWVTAVGRMEVEGKEYEENFISRLEWGQPAETAVIGTHCSYFDKIKNKNKPGPIGLGSVKRMKMKQKHLLE